MPINSLHGHNKIIHIEIKVLIIYCFIRLHRSDLYLTTLSTDTQTDSWTDGQADFLTPTHVKIGDIHECLYPHLIWGSVFFRGGGLQSSKSGCCLISDDLSCSSPTAQSCFADGQTEGKPNKSQITCNTENITERTEFHKSLTL